MNPLAGTDKVMSWVGGDRSYTNQTSSHVLVTQNSVVGAVAVIITKCDPVTVQATQLTFFYCVFAQTLPLTRVQLRCEGVKTC